MTKKKAVPEDKLPPHSTEAEQAVLGCCLLDSAAAIGDCVEKFRGREVFFDKRHQVIYDAMVEMFEGSVGVDMVTLCQRLKDSNQLETVGGIGYVSELPNAAPSAANLETYIQTVREKYLMRQLLRVCVRGATRVNECAGDVNDLLDDVEKQILEVNEERVCAREIGIREVMKRAITQLEEYDRGHGQMRGLSTGFSYLDKMVCGLAPGQLIVLAARPGMGKSSIGMNIVEHVAVELKKAVAVFSLEMTSEELGNRLLFQRAMADYQRFRTGFMRNEDVPRLVDAASKIGGSKITIDDGSDANVMELRAKSRRLRRRNGVELVMIDYLQLIRGVNRYNNREAEVADISRGLKGLAKELEIPVIVLAQLNREMEKEKNRLPRLSDLRESGSIEQDADTVWMLYEPRMNEDDEYQVENSLGSDWSDRVRRVNLLVAKQRNGPTGNVELLFHKSSMRFTEYKRNAAPAAQPAYSKKNGRTVDLPTNEELGIG